jgi:hypothetical protein
MSGSRSWYSQVRRSPYPGSSYQDRRDHDQRSISNKRLISNAFHTPITLSIAATHKVGSTEVLSDDRVPNSLTRSSHPHGQRQKSQSGHSVGVLGHQSLVSSDTGVVIDITRLSKTDNGVDEHVGLMLTSSSDGQFSVSSVHGVSGLESNDLPPRDLLEVSSKLGRGETNIHVIEVLGRLNGLYLSSDIEFLDVLPGVRDSRVSGVVSTHDSLGLESLVESVDVLDWL